MFLYMKSNRRIGNFKDSEKVFPENVGPFAKQKYTEIQLFSL